MANGGIIGPINTVVSTSIPETITAITSSGTFSVQCAPKGGIRPGSVLVIAGGAGGAGGSGGGSGGLILATCQTLSTSTICATIGGGGAGSNSAPANKGVDSIFGTLTAKGGGGGVLKC
jgi:mucin-19